MTLLKPFGDMTAAGATKLPAAPEQSTSIVPHASCVLDRASCTLAISLTSPLKPMASEVSSRNVATAASTRSCERLNTATFAPAAAKALAIPRLMPLVPPATNTVFPVNSLCCNIVTTPACYRLTLFAR